MDALGVVHAAERVFVQADDQLVEQSFRAGRLIVITSTMRQIWVCWRSPEEARKARRFHVRGANVGDELADETDGIRFRPWDDGSATR